MEVDLESCAARVVGGREVKRDNHHQSGEGELSQEESVEDGCTHLPATGNGHLGDLCVLLAQPIVLGV